MATLIAVYTSEGCIGRCDAKCYEATFHNCNCVCGGHNHGVGLDSAASNTREQAETWLIDYARKNGLSHYCGLINTNVVDQFSLFP